MKNTVEYEVRLDKASPKSIKVTRPPTPEEAAVRTESDGFATRYEYVDQSEAYGWSPLTVGRCDSTEEAQRIIREDAERNGWKFSVRFVE